MAELVHTIKIVFKDGMPEGQTFSIKKRTGLAAQLQRPFILVHDRKNWKHLSTDIIKEAWYVDTALQEAE
ncbi:hypothetical protein COI76_05440 [Bacillus cereus]|nr:hypothetical protein COI76_05440 [Bacillus cereus]PGT92320.1 hypothetical protein COD18_15940 [Bacillus cereus]